MVSMKGKGNRQTYWLLGEDPKFKVRKKQKNENIQDAAPDSNGHLLTARNSSKNQNSSFSTIMRCHSFESPKKLRFACDDNLHKKNCLEVISDGSPCKKTKIESAVEYHNNAWKTSSSSCPCMENMANSTASLTQSQLCMVDRNDKSGLMTNPICHSVPILISQHLSVPNFLAIHTFSAPASPRKPKVTDLNKFSESEEVMPWADSTPLLKVTKPQESETCV